MNFALIVVVVAAASGLASDLLLRAIAPESGPALALALMAIALLGAAWRRGRKPAPKPEAEPASASQSLTPA